jgi:transposase
MSRKSYDSDVTDVEWLLLEPLIPPEKHGGRHREVDIREVVNAIFYVLRSCWAWRLASPWCWFGPTWRGEMDRWALS